MLREKGAGKESSTQVSEGRSHVMKGGPILFGPLGWRGPAGHLHDEVRETDGVRCSEFGGEVLGRKHSAWVWQTTQTHVW